MFRFALALTLIASAANVSVADPDGVLGLSGTSSTVQPGYMVLPVNVVEGPGIKVGEGTVVQPIVGIETGFVSNPFYVDTDPTPGAIMRIVGRISTGSLSPQRLTNPDGSEAANIGSMEYQAGLQLSWDQYLSGNDALLAQGGLGVGALLRGTVRPKSTFSFLYLDSFERVLRATNYESTDRTNRDINRLALGLRYAPAGRSIDGILQFSNTIDFFEEKEQRFANRMQNAFGLTVRWRFRPVTVFFAEASQGIYTGLGSESTKVTSFPLTVTTGVQTLLSLKTSVIARIGYTNGFYSEGPSYSNVLGGLQLGYRYSPLGRFTAMYQYGYFDSINANFYRDHAMVFNIEQRFVPFALNIAPAIRLRKYEGVNAVVAGPDTRNDLIVAVNAGAQYFFRNNLAALIEYRFSTVQTNWVSADGDDPSYIRQEIVAGVRAAL